MVYIWKKHVCIIQYFLQLQMTTQYVCGPSSSIAGIGIAIDPCAIEVLNKAINLWILQRLLLHSYPSQVYIGWGTESYFCHLLHQGHAHYAFQSSYLICYALILHHKANYHCSISIMLYFTVLYRSVHITNLFHYSLWLHISMLRTDKLQLHYQI